MAEVVGIASSTITLAQLAWDSCKKLNDTIQGFRNAPENLSSLRGDLSTLLQIFGSLTQVLEPAQNESISTGQQKVLDGLRSAMQGCQKLCDDFTDRICELTSHSGDEKMSKRDRVRFYFHDTDILLLKERLVQYKLTFDIALNVASLRTTSRNDKSIENLESQVVTSLSNLNGKIESLEVVIQALSASQASLANREYSNENIPSVVTGFEQYEYVLKQCLKVHTLALQETSKLNGTTVKWIQAVDEAKQFVGNIGDVGDGGPGVCIEHAEARNQSRQIFGNMDGNSALQLLQ